MDDIKNRLSNVIENCEKQKKLEYDPEATCELFYNISEQFIDSPDLRIAWLNNLANVHKDNGNIDQYVQTKLLIALLVANYLTLIDKFSSTPINAENWKRVSPYCDLSKIKMPTKNELINLKDDICTGLEFSFNGFKGLIKDAIIHQKEGSFRERCIEIYLILLPYFIDARDFAAQEPIYKELHEICQDFISNSERIIPNYYRVAFYGKDFKELSGKEYIYTSRYRLSDFIKIITEQFGKGNISFEIAPNSKTAEELSSDKSKNYIQICNVLKHLKKAELLEKSSQAEIDLHFGVDRFSLVLPIPGKTDFDTKKKKTIYFAKGKFPGIFSRLLVDSSKTKTKIIEPIDVSRELIEEKCFDLRSEVNRKTTDTKRLQMILTGSLLATVNLGPLKIVEYYFINQTPKPKDPSVIKLAKSLVQFCSVLISGVEVNKNHKTDATNDLCAALDNAMEEFESVINNNVKPYIEQSKE